MKLTIADNAQRLNPKELDALLNPKSSPQKHVNSVLATLHTWWTRSKDRRQLGRELPYFTDEVLMDFRMTRAQAHKEVRKFFWQA